MLLQNLYVPFSIYDAFTDVRVTHAMGTNTPPQMLAFELCADNNLDGPFPLWPRGHDVHDFHKQFERWIPQPTFPLCVHPFQNALGPREAADISGCCWYKAFALHCRVLTCTCRCSDELCELTVVFLSPCGNILDRMMSVFNAVPPEGSKVTGIQCWFSALLLTCRDFSRFSFPVFCCPRPSYFGMCCRHPIQNEGISAQKQ